MARKARVRWTDDEIQSVAREFVRVRLRDIAGPIGTQLAQAEAQVLKLDRRRRLIRPAAGGKELVKAVAAESAMALAALERMRADPSAPPITLPAAPPAPPPPPTEREPIFVEIHVPRIVEVDRPVDFHRVLEATPTPLLLGYVLTKLMGSGMAMNPAALALAAVAPVKPLLDPAQIIKQATSMPPQPPPKVGPKRVLAIGFPSELTDEVRSKASQFADIEIEFVALRGYSGRDLSCDYCVLSATIGHRAPLAKAMAGRLSLRHIFTVSDLPSQVLQALANINSLQRAGIVAEAAREWTAAGTNGHG